MNNDSSDKRCGFEACLQALTSRSLSPLDLMPYAEMEEKCIELVVSGIPETISPDIAASFYQLRRYLLETEVDSARVVVFGGGTGLSNVIGGDSRLDTWGQNPFVGLKEVFPQTCSVVCITDDGGSTGEMLKDLPLIALGDIRHVLLASVAQRPLMRKYGLKNEEAYDVLNGIAAVFNRRFSAGEITQPLLQRILQEQIDLLPGELFRYLQELLNLLRDDPRFAATLQRAQCLGNLLLAAAIFWHLPGEYSCEALEEMPETVSQAVSSGIHDVAEVLAVPRDTVMPCSTTPARLRFCYANGVEATGEWKSGVSSRGYAVDHVVVDFSDEVRLPAGLIGQIEQADILIMAPGSLYSSIIPIFQVPGLADAVRRNRKALKMLIANIWVQAGETDITVSDSTRKFHISDLLRAYSRNIPGGTAGLFEQILCLSMKDIPGSVLQSYAIEGKMPIYLDRDDVAHEGVQPVECCIYSRKTLSERGVIQHDPYYLASAVKTVYLARKFQDISLGSVVSCCAASGKEYCCPGRTVYPSRKYRLLKQWVDGLQLLSPDGAVPLQEDAVQELLLETVWKHQDIPLRHLGYVRTIEFVPVSRWRREQRWDKVFSFYDPYEGALRIRSDQLLDRKNFELAFLIALGQSLLGNYAQKKEMADVCSDAQVAGKIYNLHVREGAQLKSDFSPSQIAEYLGLARMNRLSPSGNHYVRLINGDEGFTPPGVLMGLCYAWYLDNRLASHIEYKMALMKIPESDLIPEQLRMKGRRVAIIDFFRDVVFRP